MYKINYLENTSNKEMNKCFSFEDLAIYKTTKNIASITIDCKDIQIASLDDSLNNICRLNMELKENGYKDTTITIVNDSDGINFNRRCIYEIITTNWLININDDKDIDITQIIANNSRKLAELESEYKQAKLHKRAYYAQKIYNYLLLTEYFYHEYYKKEVMKEETIKEKRKGGKVNGNN